MTRHAESWTILAALAAVGLPVSLDGGDASDGGLGRRAVEAPCCAECPSGADAVSVSGPKADAVETAPPADTSWRFEPIPATVVTRAGAAG